MAIDLDMISEADDPGALNLDQIELAFSKEGLSSSGRMDEPEHLFEIYSPMTAFVDSPESEDWSLCPAALRVEVPLSDRAWTPEELRRTTISSIVDEFNGIEPDEESFPNDMEDLISQLKPVAARFLLDIQNESLTTADSATRIEVPKLDFAIPNPPWSHPRSKGDCDQMQLIREYMWLNAQDFQRWSGAIVFERLLQWLPFPQKLGLVALDETIHDDRYVQDLMELVSDESPAVDDTHVKIPRVFEAVDDDEIQQAVFDQLEKNLDMIVEEKTHTLQMKQPWKRTLDLTDQVTSYNSFFNLDALDRFLGLDGISPPKRRKPTKQHSQIQNNQLASSSRNIQPLITGPPIGLSPRSVMISSTIYQHRRSLYRLLVDLYPATYIERDFTVTVQQCRPDDPSQTVSFDPVAEADLLLSPATAIILTTLQQIQQVNLPGQSFELNSVYLRLLQISARHERVIVLVSQGCETVVDPTSPLPEMEKASRAIPALTLRQTVAFASLCAFSAGLRSAVMTHLVPGGEHELSTWIARLVDTFGIDMDIKSEETLWEQLLRRVGLNAFAACWILTDLKMPDTKSSPLFESKWESGDQNLYGLAGFMQMDTKERESRFASVMGGRTVLERVSSCVDACWENQKGKLS
jgi:hypothetical protein